MEILTEVVYKIYKKKSYRVIPVVHLAQESVSNRVSGRCYLNMYCRLTVISFLTL